MFSGMTVSKRKQGFYKLNISEITPFVPADDLKEWSAFDTEALSFECGSTHSATGKEL